MNKLHETIILLVKLLLGVNQQLRRQQQVGRWSVEVHALHGRLYVKCPKLSTRESQGVGGQN